MYDANRRASTSHEKNITSVNKSQPLRPVLPVLGFHIKGNRRSVWTAARVQLFLLSAIHEKSIGHNKGSRRPSIRILRPSTPHRQPARLIATYHMEAFECKFITLTESRKIRGLNK